jgi:hypothetical protein
MTLLLHYNGYTGFVMRCRERDQCIEDVTKAYALLKARALSWYHYTMKSANSVSCNSWDSKPRRNPITALYRVIVISATMYPDIPNGPYWMAAAAVHMRHVTPISTGASGHSGGRNGTRKQNAHSNR